MKLAINNLLILEQRVSAFKPHKPASPEPFGTTRTKAQRKRQEQKVSLREQAFKKSFSPPERRVNVEQKFNVAPSPEWCGFEAKVRLAFRGENPSPRESAEKGDSRWAGGCAETEL